MGDGVFDVEFLNSLPALFETNHIRCVSFSEPLTIQIDGKNSKGAVFKPGASIHYRNSLEVDCFD
jgi:hypothetical protein